MIDKAGRARRRILLITASSPAIQKVRRARVLNFQQITMPYLASFVPLRVKSNLTKKQIEVTMFACGAEKLEGLALRLQGVSKG